MTDREVGELWEDVSTFCGEPSSDQYWKKKFRELIYKLIEERAAMLFNEESPNDGIIWTDCTNEKSKEEYRTLACSNFGISENEYNDGKHNDKV